MQSTEKLPCMRGGAAPCPLRQGSSADHLAEYARWEGDGRFWFPSIHLSIHPSDVPW